MYARSSSLTGSISSIVQEYLAKEVHAAGAKLQPGGPGSELVCGATGTVEYLLSLSPNRDLRETYEAIEVHEDKLLVLLLEFLTAPEQKARGVRIVGEERVSKDRVPTMSFVVVGQQRMKSKDLVEAIDKKGEVSSLLLFS